MNNMMNILRKIDGLFITPVSDGADIQNTVLMEELPFKILEYKTGREHNGWTIPHKWKVIKAEIKKNGELIYDGKEHPLRVIGYSESFNGKISLEELKKHLFYNKDTPDNVIYHCDFYYKPFLKTWGFSIPYSKYKELEEGDYEVNLQTKYTQGTMKVLEYTHNGKLKDTIVFNAHNCHAAQLNDGPSAYVVLTEVMKRLKERKTKWTYKLVIAPEHMGTIFYLADMDKKEIADFKYGAFLEMLGNDSKLALQESFTGKSLIDEIAYHVLKFKSKGFWSDKFRKIVGNDETVWEAPGYEIPMISLSRCEQGRLLFFPQYHLDIDNIDNIIENKLEEAVEVILEMIDILEKNKYIKRKFEGLIALSNPKYNLYQPSGKDPSVNDNNRSEDTAKWNYLMDCIPRYFDEKTSILDISTKHDIYFKDIYSYLKKFEEKDLIEFVDK